MTQQAVLITGGTSGIGLATAELLHERGIRVMVTGSSDVSVAAARAQLPQKILVVRADTASLEDTARLVQQAEEAFGRLTGLFLNAEILAGGPIETVDEATWDRLF